METRINKEIRSTLEKFGDKYFIEGNLNKSKVIQDLDRYDKDLLEAFVSSETLKANFTIDIKGNFLIQTNKLIEIFEADEYWQDSYTKYSKKIGLTANRKFIDESTDVVLDFPYKDTVLKASMSKEDTDKDDLRPDEPFLNEIIAKEEIDVLLDKKILVNAKNYSQNGAEEINHFNENDNLIIKGNNLLALHTLKEKYIGKIKLIYIDPPYNTGKDSFKYNDRFNRSTWLTFMKNRIEVARDLLSNDGVLIVQADDKMQAYLKILLDEIMGTEQFETSFYVQVRYGNKTLSEDNDFQKVMEVCHVYSKITEEFVPNKLKEEYSLEKFKYRIVEKGEPDKTEIINGKKVDIFQEGNYEIEEIEPNIDGLKETWATGSLIRQGGTAAEFLSKHLIKRKEEDGLKTLYKVYGMGDDGIGYRYITGPRKKDAFRGKFFSGVPSGIREGVISGDYSKEKPIPNFLYNYLQYEADFGNCRHEGGVDIGGGKKPEMLLSSFIDYFTDENDFVLDFFGGSGTTAATAHKMNRRYISIEQLDDHIEKMVERLINVIKGDDTGISKDVNWQGGGSFVYAELMEKNRGFLKSIRNAENQIELKKVFDFMLDEAEIDFRVDLEKVKDTIHELSVDEQKRTLIKIIDKNQLYYHYSEIDDENVRDLVSENDYGFNKSFYEESGE